MTVESSGLVGVSVRVDRGLRDDARIVLLRRGVSLQAFVEGCLRGLTEGEVGGGHASTVIAAGAGGVNPERPVSLKQDPGASPSVSSPLARVFRPDPRVKK